MAQQQIWRRRSKRAFDTGSTIWSIYTFPNNRIKGNDPINQARGINGLIDDRFDLTLNAFELFYVGKKARFLTRCLDIKTSLTCLEALKDITSSFYFDDLVDENKKVRFYLSFDNFKTKPTFIKYNDYLTYKNGVMNFIKARNRRIENYANQQTAE
ncbi:MAG: hypothetical protein U5K51_03785 [Flavobacteriaceae bacterium]|nr:hypothetical protein [Flavobacteriaceae bacterium]